ncbi:Cys/Met metabolism PLP-dependent enzyme-domain-containing protein [Macrophomina phaseolina]|uniref:Cys/Met metabolism PLP-dependent enzyme-domain-containing protein n=1 Tax=Macrophomina phaseolina TaxID=35725 RepID=A0ABQ8FVC7_9PEZI|nr:Cys/Met metabolism PLP-dependent enzyme-domain-containing protein [Macrophomina phaseolina]
MTDALKPYRQAEGENAGRRFNTLQVHAGQSPDSQTKARAVPIYATASFVFENSKHAKEVCGNETEGYVYSRISNPTVEVFEKRVAALEGGSAAVACASGQAAVFQTILALARAGDNIVASIHLYGGSYSLLKELLPRLGIEVRWAAPFDAATVAGLIDARTKMVFFETIGNPTCNVPDFEGLARVAHAQGVVVVVDNTFGACGAFCRALDHGADIVVHSATKWIGGHGTSVGGAIIDGGRFDWGAAAARYPQVSAVGSQMDFSYWKQFGRFAFAMLLRVTIVMEVGGVLSPFAAHELLLGLETLSLRCERIASNSLAVARFLEAHAGVAWVNYPGLESAESHVLARKYLTGGFGGVMSFGVKGGVEGSCTFLDNLRLVSNMTNVGDCKTMVTHPWSSTHVILSEQDRIKAGITEDFLRLSVGTEDVDDLIEDLSRALGCVVSTA